jgi:regulator of replication initiation timing
MQIQILDIINVLTPILGVAVGWFVGRRKQKNDFLNELQASIDLLAAKNHELMTEVVEVVGENVRLRIEAEILNRTMEVMKKITDVKSVKPNEPK